MSKIRSVARKSRETIGDQGFLLLFTTHFCSCRANRRRPASPRVTRTLEEAIFSGAEESDKAQVSQYLELLTDFGADVAIGWMQTREAMFCCIDIA